MVTHRKRTADGSSSCIDAIRELDEWKLEVGEGREWVSAGHFLRAKRKELNWLKAHLPEVETHARSLWDGCGYLNRNMSETMDTINEAITKMLCLLNPYIGKRDWRGRKPKNDASHLYD